MKIERESVQPFDFDGLEIRDYTADLKESASWAEISVPAGVRHKRAWSRRSDKYYYVLVGRLRFTIDDRVVELAAGDLCIIRKGGQFSYENTTAEISRILLIHTPSFDLDEEVFEE